MGTVKGMGAVEAVLFASGKAMEEEHIKEIIGLKPKETRTALEALQKSYDTREGALFIWNEGTKWKINVKEEHAVLIRTLAAETELPRAVLETLAIIAYRTPVLQSEIVDARGDGAYTHITELEEKGFITKEKFGRSFKIKITDKFYHYFDVEGDKDIREAFKDAKQPDVNKIAQEAEKKLGQLEVVDAITDEESLTEHRKETQLEIYNIEQQREDDKKNYLHEFETRLGEVSGRISEAEGDILAQKKQAQQDAEGSEQNVDGNEELMEKEMDNTENIADTTTAEKPIKKQKTKSKQVAEDSEAETTEKERKAAKKQKAADLQKLFAKKDYDEAKPEELVKDINEQIEELTRKEED